MWTPARRSSGPARRSPSSGPATWWMHGASWATSRTTTANWNQRSMGFLLIRVLATAAAIGLLTGASGSLTAGKDRPPIIWEAHSFSLDTDTHLIHLRGDVKISQKNPSPQGEISIEADEAQATSTSKDSKNSHWVFTGKVHVRAESQGDLHSDHATLEILNGELASALVTGS